MSDLPSLLLDTNILWNLALCERLTEKVKVGVLRVYIPTLIHAERIRQVANHYGERFAIDVVRQFIADSGFELRPLTVEDAEAVAEIWLELKAKGMPDNYWGLHRFDIVLCGIARSCRYMLITDNTRDKHFECIPERMTTKELEEWLESI